uniref:Putative secreted protein n=1 Tax=Anopheles darlingi TaxID=43151 RepID=A0A2M4DKX3_ANODA
MVQGTITLYVLSLHLVAVCVRRVAVAADDDANRRRPFLDAGAGDRNLLPFLSSVSCSRHHRKRSALIICCVRA